VSNHHLRRFEAADTVELRHLEVKQMPQPLFRFEVTNTAEAPTAN